jgi:hypothetical protein
MIFFYWILFDGFHYLCLGIIRDGQTRKKLCFMFAIKISLNCN